MAMRLTHRHDWRLALSEAIDLQRRMRAEMIADPPLDLDRIKVAGVDVSVRDDVSKATVAVHKAVRTAARDR
ncbi:MULTISPECIES: hypothetical protein [unclassified Chelatococcus]|uniref:hypothetical protein n=1 Tax=unclassified Chelatococcus TaxID=2638111 RepID=UPI001BCFDF7E|nr:MULTISPECIES: hypothetical protein [unclassified Chelatococcus]MBS7697754.1 hypothetical protein [Chelatococcus sp. YT9]MBX3558389.1 hypothetical protein [Chelatococcus sp.]